MFPIVLTNINISVARKAVLSVAVLAAVTLLAACGSTPLPPWPASKAPLPSSHPGHVVAPEPGSSDKVSRAGAVVAPGLPRSEPEANSDAPFGASVAAHFPDPMVKYRTPGLSEGRRAFTTNAELGEWLRSIVPPPQVTGARAQLLQMGPSQQGQPILALVLTRGKGTSPDALGATGRPTVLLMGQQRGDEPAGAEALLVMAQELGRGLLEPLLDRVNVIVVPRANPDAADSGNPFTDAGVDMVSDHLLVSTPEARAIATLMRDYRPTLLVDAREFEAGGALLKQFGGVPSYDALLEYSTAANVPDFITKAAREWYYEPMAAALSAERLRADWYFAAQPDASGPRVFADGVQPDTARNVTGLKNGVGMVVATRGAGIGRAHIQRRVHTHVVAMSSLLRSTAERASSLEQVRSFVARDTSAQACRSQFTTGVTGTPAQRTIALLDPQTGTSRQQQVDWDTPLKLRSIASRARPCGYWLSAASENVVDRLQLLGLQVLRVAESGSMLADSYQATGSGTVLRRNTIDAPEGSFYIPLNQPLANVAVAALEPDGTAGYLAHTVIDDATQVARIVATPSLVFEEGN